MPGALLALNAHPFGALGEGGILSRHRLEVDGLLTGLLLDLDLMEGDGHPRGQRRDDRWADPVVRVDDDAILNQQAQHIGRS